MARTTARSKRKISGGRYKSHREKRLHELASEPTLTRLANTKKKTVRTYSGHAKERLLNVQIVNILNPKTKKYAKAKITAVLETPANRHFVRRAIMTKGAIIQTELGKARITSRPGQEGSLNAVLI